MNPTALYRAHYIHQHHPTMDRQARVDAAIELAEYGVFSNRHVSELTGLRPAFVNELTGKTDRTGGTMNPQRLGDLADVAEARNRGEDVRARIAELAEDGFSSTTIARLTGIPVSSIGRWIG